MTDLSVNETSSTQQLPPIIKRGDFASQAVLVASFQDLVDQLGNRIGANSLSAPNAADVVGEVTSNASNDFRDDRGDAAARDRGGDANQDDNRADSRERNTSGAGETSRRDEDVRSGGDRGGAHAGGGERDGESNRGDRSSDDGRGENAGARDRDGGSDTQRDDAADRAADESFPAAEGQGAADQETAPRRALQLVAETAPADGVEQTASADGAGQTAPADGAVEQTAPADGAGQTAPAADAGQAAQIPAALQEQTTGVATARRVGDASRAVDPQAAARSGQEASSEVLRAGVFGIGENSARAAQSRAAVQNAITQGAADGASQAESRLQPQVAQLASAAGNNGPLAVNVTVTREAATLTNTSTVTATAQAAVMAASQGAADDGADAAQTNAQTNAQTAQQNPQAQAAAAAAVLQNGGQFVQGQSNQGQANAQASQAASQTADAARTTIQTGANNTGASGFQAQSGGGEAQTAQTGTSSQTQQTSQDFRATLASQTRQPARGSVVDQVQVQISKAVKLGADKINIKLNPAELGRVEIKLQTVDGGRTVATVTAERQETLDILRRDSAELQRALSDAGLDLARDGLNYNLKGENNNQPDQEIAGGGNEGDEDFLDSAGEAVAAHELGVITNGRVDVRA